MNSYKTVAEEAVAQCQKFEAELNQLKAVRKQAAAVIQDSVQAMIKCGCLEASQKAQAAKLMRDDPNAALRAIQGLCNHITNAQHNVKRASLDMNCGKLVSTYKVTDNHESDMRSVAKILGLHIN